jgi:hypothetical protein
MDETIRAVSREDVPAVAGMFARVFMKRRAASPDLTSYVENLVLAPGSRGPGEPRSRVFVDAQGAVRGFIGIWPRRMVLDGRPVEAATAGSMMVDHPEEHPTAGARLLRAFLAGPQQLSFSETANATSQRMWERLGGERLATASLEWLRVFRPAGLCVATAARSFGPARILRPIAAAADHVIASSGLKLLPDEQGAGYTTTDASTAEILDLIPRLSQSYGLRPDWQSPNLSLLLSHAGVKERYGELQRRVVYGRNREPVACYLYYARRGDIARVLQVVALQGSTGAAIDSLFHHSASLGCVGVRGRSEPAMLDALAARRCLFYQGAAMVVHARDKALLEEVRHSRALLTGLGGESWNRLIGGSFA